MNIAVVLVGDEEMAAQPTEISRAPLTEQAKKSDIALGFEFALSTTQLVTKRRGLSEWFLTSKGLDQHSATIFQPNTGYGAIFEAARVLDQMRSELSNTPGLTINPGLIVGGATSNEDIESGKGAASGRKTSVAKICSVHGDLRFTSTAQSQMAETKINSIIRNSLPKTTTEFKLQSIMPVMEDSEGNRNMLKEYSQVSLDLGGPPLEAVPASQRGGADISYISNIIPAALDGLGPSGLGAHSPNETIDISSLSIATKRAAIFMSRYDNRTE